MSSSRRQVPIEIKIKIIEDYNKGVMPEKISSKFGISKAVIYTIRRNEKVIKENYSSLKDPNNKEMERALYKWYVSHREKNVYVREKDLMDKAEQLYNSMYNKKFHCNKIWLSDFKNRFQIRLGEKFYSNAQLMSAFNMKLSNIMAEKGLSLDVIFKAEMSGLFWKVLPNNAICTGETRDVPRERITFLVCSNASGTLKLTPFAVGRIRQPRSFRNKEVPIDYSFSQSACITGSLIVYWFFHKFIPQVEAFLVAENRPFQAILLLEKMPGFPSEHVLTKDAAGGQIAVQFLPSQIEVSFNQTMNAITMTKLWYKKILLHKIKMSEYPVNMALRQINFLDAVYLLSFSWKKISTVFIRKWWRSLLSIDMMEFGEEDDSPLSVIQTEEEIAIISETLHTINYVFSEKVFTVDDVWCWLTIDRELEDNYSDSDFSDSEDAYF